MANSMYCVLLITGITMKSLSRIAFMISWFAEKLMKIAVFDHLTSALLFHRIFLMFHKALARWWMNLQHVKREETMTHTWEKASVTGGNMEV